FFLYFFSKIGLCHFFFKIFCRIVAIYSDYSENSKIGAFIMSQVTLSNQSTWASKLKAMGPGILMASAAVGGSHIVSSTQAGGSYGWSLLLLVILANVFKYPFFRFGAEYTADTGKTLVEGYAEKGKLYLWIFFVLNVFSAMVNTAGVAILCSAIIASAFPMIGLSITQWSLILVAVIWAMLLFGGYKLLDGMAKWIMSALTIATVLAVIIAAIKHPEYSSDFVEKTPWQMASLPFIVSLLGWMPALLKFQPSIHSGLLKRKRPSTLIQRTLFSTLTLVTLELLS
ncbi:hypothetical protein HMPREF0849_00798, partial [Streptococcus sp. C300]